MYYRVIPFGGSFDTYGLVYSFGEDIKLGSIIKIPLRNIETYAILGEKLHRKDVNIDISHIKEISVVVSDMVFLSEKQYQIIDFVSKHYITPIHNAVILYFPKNLLEKIKKNTVSKIIPKDYIYRDSQISLSMKQEDISTSISCSKHKKHLIYGVTGSGKTQIYMKVIKENLKKGKQSLLLIPEIILTSQIGEKIKKTFGEQVIILHSGVSAAKKSQYWMDIYSGNAKIIIGTRSSLFYPYNNLGAIIIDEEHDESYISDQSPRYHSLDIAEKLSELYDIPLILGSGTPKVTTFYRAIKGEFELHQLLEKYQ